MVDSRKAAHSVILEIKREELKDQNEDSAFHFVFKWHYWGDDEKIPFHRIWKSPLIKTRNYNEDVKKTREKIDKLLKDENWISKLDEIRNEFDKLATTLLRYTPITESDWRESLDRLPNNAQITLYPDKELCPPWEITALSDKTGEYWCTKWPICRQTEYMDSSFPPPKSRGQGRLLIVAPLLKFHSGDGVDDAITQDVFEDNLDNHDMIKRLLDLSRKFKDVFQKESPEVKIMVGSITGENQYLSLDDADISVATKDAVKNALKENWTVVFFLAHVEDQKISLANSDFLDTKDVQTLSEYRRQGCESIPIVLLGGCKTGSLVDSFVRIGAQSVVATNWSVRLNHGLEFAEAFLGMAIGPQEITIANAMHETRRQMTDTGIDTSNRSISIPKIFPYFLYGPPGIWRVSGGGSMEMRLHFWKAFDYFFDPFLCHKPGFVPRGLDVHCDERELQEANDVLAELEDEKIDDDPLLFISSVPLSVAIINYDKGIRVIGELFEPDEKTFSLYVHKRSSLAKEQASGKDFPNKTMLKGKVLGVVDYMMVPAFVTILALQKLGLRVVPLCSIPRELKHICNSRRNNLEYLANFTNNYELMNALDQGLIDIAIIYGLPKFEIDHNPKSDYVPLGNPEDKLDKEVLRTVGPVLVTHEYNLASQERKEIVIEMMKSIQMGMNDVLQNKSEIAGRYSRNTLERHAISKMIDQVMNGAIYIDDDDCVKFNKFGELTWLILKDIYKVTTRDPQVVYEPHNIEAIRKNDEYNLEYIQEKQSELHQELDDRCEKERERIDEKYDLQKDHASQVSAESEKIGTRLRKEYDKDYREKIDELDEKCETFRSKIDSADTKQKLNKLSDDLEKAF